jgi:ribonuclease BN (tRNA processing enzyme)
MASDDTNAFTLRDSPNQRLGLSGCSVRVGLFRVHLVGGFFDNPTILVSHARNHRGMLLDLGEVQRLPVRVLNKVTDAFVTHAHTDHFAGFIDLLRTRVHNGSTCRIFGPAQMADRVESMVDAFTWDRLADGEGPEFVVGEFGDQRVDRWRIRAGEPRRQPLQARSAPDGCLLDEPRFTIRTCQLDHGTPVLAYTIEESENYAVRADRLEPPLSPGPWLGELKSLYARRELDVELELPDGRRRSVDELADEFLIVGPGEKLTYATDFGDTPANRHRVVDLAAGSDVFICEAYYARADADRAEQFGHLTTTACAEIARQAEVDRLIPFHFSTRYEEEPERLYREIREVYPTVDVPEPIVDRLDDR